MKPTENAIALWWYMFHCSDNVRLALFCIATPIPTDILLLHDITTVAVMINATQWPSQLIKLFRLSADMPQYIFLAPCCTKAEG
jgi:hypothetical protein